MSDDNDNDFRALAESTKRMRDERAQRFSDEWLEPLRQRVGEIAHDSAMEKYSFEHAPYGKIDYYAKANKLLIRERNQWIKPGLKWLIKNVIL